MDSSIRTGRPPCQRMIDDMRKLEHRSMGFLDDVASRTLRHARRSIQC